MLFLPKNDGEFEEAIKRFKENYLARKMEDDPMLLDGKEYSEKQMEAIQKRFDRKFKNEKAKREFCRLINKEIECELEGKKQEAKLASDKFSVYKRIYMNKKKKG